MPRSRRFTAVVVLALFGALGLTGCGNEQPGTAAYVGGTRYTENQVDELVADIERARSDSKPVDQRGFALSRLILVDLGRRVVSAQSLIVEPARYDEFAQGLGLPTDSKLVRMLADFQVVLAAVSRSAQPITPTEDDFREIWDAVRNDPQRPPNVTYEDVRAVLGANTNLPTALGIRNLLREQADRSKVVVNPAYRPLMADIGSGDVSVRMLLGEDAGFVADLAND